MSQEPNSPLYRVIFAQDDQIYEVFGRGISDESLMGFLEVDELIFTNQDQELGVDLSEERLQTEFMDVRRTYIPLHLILRVDEMVRSRPLKLKPASGASNVHVFPVGGVRGRAQS